MTTVREMMADIGKKGSITVSGLTIDVEVLDVKISYAQKRWLVKPVAGKGETWVQTVELIG